MKKLLITLGLVAMVAYSATAQTMVKNNYDNDQVGTYQRVTKMGPYLTNRFFDNIFIGVAGGVNFYDNNDGAVRPNFGDRLAPSLDVHIGKWITPAIGFRLGYNGLKSKSIDPMQDFEINEDPSWREFDYVFVHGDFLWDVTSAFAGHKADRTWSVIPFIGFGWAHSWGDNLRENKIAGVAGLLNNFRLGGVVDLTLEGKYMLVDDGFDGFAAQRQYEGILSVTAGLTFKLGPKEGFRRPIYNAPADYTPYQRRIDALESDLARERSTIERLNRELQDARNRPTTTTERVFTPVNISSFFGIGKTEISEKDMINIENVAQAMKSQPNDTFNVTGYADSSTGSVRRNQELSDKRAENVANALVNKFGVNRSQLNVSGKGGVRMHENPVLDRRVVID